MSGFLAKIRELFKDATPARITGLEILKYIGPGLLVTVGFIDPGNWASNMAAGSQFGYTLLWIVTLSTIMLIFLQHNAAHLGISTGLCISEAATKHLRPTVSRTILISAMLACVSTALAEILGAAIALKMLFNLPLKIGSVLALIFVSWMLYTNAYRKIEKIIIGFVSLIGIAFIVEILLVKVDWTVAAAGTVVPLFPLGSMVIIMSVLGAVVMPHNLFLHSEIIQSRQWQNEKEEFIKDRLKFEFLDTLFSMGVGWAINSAMIVIAAAVFFTNSIPVTELEQAKKTLEPLLGSTSAVVFAVALLLAGIASSLTAGIAGASIFAGILGEPYDIADKHSRIGAGITLIGGTVAIFFISNPFKGLLISQMLLSIQLPITVFTLIYLTSSKKVMGKFKNDMLGSIILYSIAIILTVLNIKLLIDSFA
ncbi:MAG TPA: Mg2+/Co2+ transporter [Lentisphaeria bacterium]|nr:MAG: Mg2+/Co2+ transporter [Lentisphaerae bacterium GWF2_50_93]HCE45021.1 Mg2+/Co2+ transporter [Lentisphaeria bacterium]